jgi:hypothetical protein
MVPTTPDSASAPRPRYAALVPPSSLRAGANTIAVLEVQPGGELRPVG